MLELVITRVLPAARPTVFANVTERDALARWWGPRGFTVPWIRFDPQVGATYRIEMRPPEGAPFFLTGELRAVDPPARLGFTFRWEPPDPDDAESTVDLAFGELGDATEVRLTQGPFRTAARLEVHRTGWTESLDRLGGLLR
jgi:uncharacterized protein YndB with AHSA1/START domain